MCSSVERVAEAMEHPVQRGGREPGSPRVVPAGVLRLEIKPLSAVFPCTNTCLIIN